MTDWPGRRPLGRRTMEQVKAYIDEQDSLNGVGASETAYFVATGPADVTDTSEHDVTLEADDRHGELPDWATLVDGSVVLTSDAGTCAYSLAGAFDLDFTGASATPDDPGYTYSYFAVNGDTGFYVDTTEGTTITPGDGQTTQATPQVGTGGLLLGTTFTVSGRASAFATAAEGDPIDDGTATPRVALTITRIAQAAVLPE